MNSTFKEYQQWNQKETDIYSKKLETIKIQGTSVSSITAPSTSIQTKKCANKIFSKLFVKLANESIAYSDSEDSVYDSLNERETDSCHDSDGSDTVGSDSMEMVEYEIDDISSSDDLDSSGSSSGIDDFVDVIQRAIFDTTSSSDDFHDLEVLADDADTEESDAPTDPELGPADYWTCIKCKNRKNNPMYRFCERCFQVRKTHFPPRPKHKKKRKNNSERLLLKDLQKLPESPSTSASSLSSAGEGKSKKRISHDSNSSDNDSDFGKLLNSNCSKKVNVRKQKQQARNSAGDSSCCSSQELSPDEQQPSNSKYLDACPSSQETYCSQIERIVDETKQNSQSHCRNFDTNYINSQESLYSISQEMPTNELLTYNLCGQSSAVNLEQIPSSASSGFHSLSSQSEEHVRSESFVRSSVDLLSVVADDINGKQDRGIKRNLKRSGNGSDSDLDPKRIKRSQNSFDDELLKGPCNICFSQPKNCAFVHTHRLHVYCCYRCAVKVWNKTRRCPICNIQAKTVMKMFVH